MTGSGSLFGEWESFEFDDEEETGDLIVRNPSFPDNFVVTSRRRGLNLEDSDDESHEDD